MSVETINGARVLSSGTVALNSEQRHLTLRVGPGLLNVVIDLFAVEAFAAGNDGNGNLVLTLKACRAGEMISWSGSATFEGQPYSVTVQVIGLAPGPQMHTVFYTVTAG